MAQSGCHAEERRAARIRPRSSKVGLAAGPAGRPIACREALRSAKSWSSGIHRVPDEGRGVGVRNPSRYFDETANDIGMAERGVGLTFPAHATQRLGDVRLRGRPLHCAVANATVGAAQGTCRRWLTASRSPQATKVRGSGPLPVLTQMSHSRRQGKDRSVPASSGERTYNAARNLGLITAAMVTVFCKCVDRSAMRIIVMVLVIFAPLAGFAADMRNGT